MNMYDLITKKRDGGTHSQEEISHIIKGYIENKIPDYQISAWLMAVYFSGMTDEEAANLTMTMAESGDMMDLRAIKGAKVDKHSSGGVGDKTTLVLGPIVACCGVKVAKMSGRGLGHTGGTLDKLEAIPGFKINIDPKLFFDIVNTTGLAVVGQTGNLAPADKKIYALRDVTATVDSIPLIAASIMGKKLAAGNDGIVLDVKCGKGAFMTNLADAKKLAKLMVEIGKIKGKNMSAVISAMDQPLGSKIGNALEVEEALDTLKGKGPEDFTLLCIELAAEMLKVGHIGNSKEERISLIKEKISNGEALEKFREMIKAQGGNSDVVDNYEIMGKASHIIDFVSKNSGFISEIDALKVGKAAMFLGAGRATKEDKIDMTVGIELFKKIGDKVQKDEILGKIFYNSDKKLEEAKKMLMSAYKFEEIKEKSPVLIYDIIH
ncbi:MAG: pyrimidine-nucleoside phosphorylase [Candidatus Muirbacterium halophilum]|nr:pyrimidine-nucleoside phosphorylase [Candidatus Muirbacterium halophilum]MCK9475661.1 pyrimidine-nucleoside phosphorylase [Candidatus Muirbacterium halophilum]